MSAAPRLTLAHAPAGYALIEASAECIHWVDQFGSLIRGVIESREGILACQQIWSVGCNIVLDKIPVHARIPVIEEGNVRSKQTVREAYQRLRPLERLQVEKRGWTLDVLQVVLALVEEREQEGRAKATPLHREFSLQEVYAHADALAELHPANRYIQPKIRQQLQVLRDLGLLKFMGSGSYCLV